MKRPLNEGARVRWRNGDRWASGRVVESHPRKVIQVTNSPEAAKYFTSDQLSYLIDQDDGGCVLKSQSEVEPMDEARPY